MTNLGTEAYASSEASGLGLQVKRKHVGRKTRGARGGGKRMDSATSHRSFAEPVRVLGDYWFYPQSLLMVRSPRRPHIDEGRFAAPSVNAQQCRSLALFLTTACNYRCSYCYEAGGDPQRFDANAVRDSIERLVPSSDFPLVVTFFGGEPMLEWGRLVDMVEWLEATYGRVFLRMVTNGSLLTEDAGAFLRQHRFRVSVSLDGRQAVNDQKRRPAGRGSAYSATTSGIAAARLGDLLRFRLTVSNHNARSIGQEVLHLHETFGTKSFAWGIDYDALDSTSIRELLDHVESALPDWIAARIHLDAIDCLLRAIHYRRQRIAHCSAGVSYLALSPSGDAFFCPRFVMQRTYPMATFGDGACEHERLRRGCVKCSCLSLCGGPCLHSARAQADYCAYRSGLCLLTLRLYAQLHGSGFLEYATEGVSHDRAD